MPIKLVQELHEAESIADELGYLVVMKITSPDILHKSDLGDVKLNAQSHGYFVTGYTQILRQEADPKPTLRRNLKWS